MDWKEKTRRDIFEKNRPTLLLGSGASISTGISLNLEPNFPSMASLTKYFCDNIVTDGFKPEEITAFEVMHKELHESYADGGQFNLEAFLASHPLRQDSKFLQKILQYTGEAFKSPHDSLTKILETNPSSTYPLRDILEALIRSLPAAYPELQVITPNYDLLIEYSADLIGAPCLTGFCGGIIRSWNPEIGLIQPTMKRNNKIFSARRIRLIKPHGSFAWFQSKADPNLIIENFAIRELNGDWRRHMVIPGPTKYSESLKDICRDHMRYMDQAFMKVKSLIVIGYGFNDPHLEEYLKRSLSRGIPAIYVTKNLSQSALKSFVFPYPNVTCIISDDVTGSRVYCGDTEISCPDKRLWMLENFTKEFVR
jgi:hypothetical protein